jgi:membrane fusion protein (multidrug efflux system)
VIQVTDTMRVVTYVTEQEINSIQIGSECVVTTPGVRGREYTARVESRDGEVDPTTGNFPVKLTVENNDGLLKSGMTAVVVMAGLEVGNTLLIPESALVDRNRKRVVFRLDDGIAEEVEPGLAATMNDELLPVLRGLSAGDEIIISGLNTVVAGTRVEVVQAVANGEEKVLPEPPLGLKTGSEAEEGSSN